MIRRLVKISIIVHIKVIIQKHLTSKRRMTSFFLNNQVKVIHENIVNANKEKLSSNINDKTKTILMPLYKDSTLWI